ncbi:MAG: hypothetical protein EB029_03825 [Actinobacteria bacterium]|nr:hypothetical protein [Actinomycetota bacterium]
MKQIQVFVRHCFYSPNTELRGHSRPSWFDKAAVFQNLLDTTDHNLADIHVVYDEHFGKLEETFLSKFENVTVINAGNEAQSFLKTLELVFSYDFDDETIIYLLEDDYLHKPNWSPILLEAFTLPVEYASLYDHLDKYIGKQYRTLSSQIFATKSCHWRTSPSTTNTYASRYLRLKEDKAIHKHYSESAQKGVSRDHEKFVYLGKSGRRLVTSIPGYSTQCDDFLLSSRFFNTTV